MDVRVEDLGDRHEPNWTIECPRGHRFTFEDNQEKADEFAEKEHCPKCFQKYLSLNFPLSEW